jgi:hypothetical protein
VLRVLLLALAVAAAPLPVLAGETTATPPSPIKASIQKVVASRVVTLAKVPAAQANQASGTDLASPSFFKSKAGVVALVATAVGIGFALYSTSNDRVKSPAK